MQRNQYYYKVLKPQPDGSLTSIYCEDFHYVEGCVSHGQGLYLCQTLEQARDIVANFKFDKLEIYRCQAMTKVYRRFKQVSYEYKVRQFLAGSLPNSQLIQCNQLVCDSVKILRRVN